MVGSGLGGTIRIAIVDDGEQERSRIAQLIHFCMRILKNNTSDYELFQYKNAEDFIEIFGKGLFHIVFLGIKTGSIDGIEAARYIRRFDDDCRIIFLTETPDYVEESYSVRATHYLLTPVDFSRLMEAFSFCDISKIIGKPLISVKNGQRSRSISLDKIVYIEHKERKTFIHLWREVIVSDDSFTEVTAPLLYDKRFLICFRGVMVNMEYVDKIDGQDFLMTNRERVPIVIRGSKKIRDQFEDFQKRKFE